MPVSCPTVMDNSTSETGSLKSAVAVFRFLLQRVAAGEPDIEGVAAGLAHAHKQLSWTPPTFKSGVNLLRWDRSELVMARMRDEVATL